MTGENGGKEDGGKHSTKNGLRRAAANILGHGRSEKELPAHPQTPPAAATGNPMESRTRAPKRSQTVDVPAAQKPTNQAPAPQGATEYPPAPPTNSAAAPTPTPAQIPATVPPTLIPGQVAGTGQAPPAVTPAKRSERPEQRIEQSERIERPRSVDPQAQRARERERDDLKDLIQALDLRNRDLEERLRFYETEQYRGELLSIRTHLQVNDLLEPWQISQQFQAINKAIENVSRNLSEHLADSYEPKGQCTTSDFVFFSQYRAPKIERDPTGSPVAAEDFIDFCSRSLINEHLSATIFNPHTFHPGLNEQDNNLLTEMYGSVRMKERQIIAGRWRISSFNIYKSTEYRAKDIAFNFCQKILSRLCRDIYGDKPAEEALNKVYSEIVAVFEHAWEWYSLAKSSVVLLDFEPFYVHPGSQYVPDHHTLEGRKPKLPSSGAILLTSRLGLISSEAQGEDKPPTRIVQLKATTLAAEYFLS